MINANQLKTETFGDWINTIFTYSFITICSLAPLIFGLIIYKNTNNLKTPIFQNKYGELSIELRKDSKIAQYFNIIVLTRWVLSILVFIFLRDSPGLQTSCLLIQSLFMKYFYYKFKPQEESILESYVLLNENNSKIINELFISLYLYFSIMLLMIDNEMTT